MLAFLVSSAISLPLVAEDNRDYSTYIKLKKNTTLTETDGGWPKADAWNPEGDMEDGKNYLVPSGISLASNTKSTAEAGGTWPGKELAIEGSFSVSATGNRSKSAIIPRLALLPGGRILMKTAYGTINGDTLDIRGTNGAPSSIEYNYANANNNGNYYPQLNIAITGDSDSVVRFEYTGTGQNYSDFQRAFRVLGGFADFHGTVIVDGERTWLRPMTTSVTFDIGGTLVITNSANVYVDTVSPTFGSLVMAEGSTLQIAAWKTVTAAHASFVDATVEIAENSRIDLTGSFAAVSPVKLKLSYAPVAYRTVVMTLPVGKGVLRKDDFAIDGEPQFRSVLSVDTVDGIQVLWIKNLNPDIKDATTGYVYQKTADGSSASYTIGSYNMAGNWSEEGAAPHHGTNYYTEVYFRDKGTKEDLFQGDSLTQAYTFRPTRKSFNRVDFRNRGIERTGGHTEKHGTHLVVLVGINLCAVIIVELFIFHLDSVANCVGGSVLLVQLVFLGTDGCSLLSDAVHNGVVLVVETTVVGRSDGTFSGVHCDVAPVFYKDGCAVTTQMNVVDLLVGNGVGKGKVSLDDQARVKGLTLVVHKVGVGTV